jgi:hypothetical protein
MVADKCNGVMAVSGAVFLPLRSFRTGHARLGMPLPTDLRRRAEIVNSFANTFVRKNFGSQWDSTAIAHTDEGWPVKGRRHPQLPLTSSFRLRTLELRDVRLIRGHDFRVRQRGGNDQPGMRCDRFSGFHQSAKQG